MKHVIVITLLAFIFDACTPRNTQQDKLPYSISEARIVLADSLQKYIHYQEPMIALINATVVDGTGGEIRKDQSIIIENGYFKTIDHHSSVDIPTDAAIIDLQGKTLIPGIVGIHNHLHIPRFPFLGDLASKMYLASGVTTIQTCGSASPSRELTLAQQIAEGLKPGPDIMTSGPYFTGPGGSRSMIIPRNAQHIRDTMQHWIKQGVSWFKVYRHTRPDDLKIILDEAHRNKAKVTGHLCSITFSEASRMGIDGIEHGLNSTADFRTDKDYGLCNGGRAYMDELNIASPKVKELHQLMIDHEVFLTSTLAIYESSIPSRAFADERTLQAMSPYLLDQYQAARARHEQQAQDSVREKRLERIMAFEHQFFKMGGRLGSGVDAGRHNLFGFGDQRNFELFIEAGFTTEEAIMVMTNNGASILGKSEIGSIEIGKRADFVILNGDLSKDPAIIRQVENVFKAGIGYNPKLLLQEVNGKVGLE